MSDKSIAKRDTVTHVTERIREFQRNKELVLPASYSVENALKSAWLSLQQIADKDKNPVLEVCSRESIANSLLDMAVQGLSPAKKQCYFIAYGKTLVCQRSYFGDLALLYRTRPDVKCWYSVIYEGDDFTYKMERGQVVVLQHEQQLSNVKPDKIVGAYAAIEDQDGNLVNTCLMTMEQIKRSWMQSRRYKPDGGETPHHTFPDQMALRTVIRRVCKPVINEASDDYLLMHHMHHADDTAAQAAMEAEMAENANAATIDFDDNGPDVQSEPPNGVSLLLSDGTEAGKHQHMGAWIKAFSEQLRQCVTRDQAQRLWQANAETLDAISKQERFSQHLSHLSQQISELPYEGETTEEPGF